MGEDGDSCGHTHGRADEERDCDGDAVEEVVKRVADEDERSRSVDRAMFFVAVVPENEFFDGEEEEKTYEYEQESCLDDVASTLLCKTLDRFGHEFQKGDGQEGAGGKREKQVGASGRPKSAFDEGECEEEGDEASDETGKDDVKKRHKLFAFKHFFGLGVKINFLLQ